MMNLNTNLPAGSSLYFLTQGLPVFLLCLLPLVHPSLSFYLKSCSIDFSEDASADVVLDCSCRDLVAIPDDIPSDANVVKLWTNQLKRINREDFCDLSKLRVLHLESNQIAHVDDGSFIHLVALRELHMSGNRLTNLTGSLFQGLSNLTFLRLDDNNIQFIHASAFHFLSSLQTVMLGANKLRRVSDLQPVLQLPHLQKLSVGENLFSSFQTQDLLLNMSSGLKVLDLSDSKLEKFSISTNIFPHLELIDLSRGGAALKWDIPDKTLLRSITQLYFSSPSIPLEELLKVLQSIDSLMHLRLNYMEKWIHKGLLATVCRIPTLKRLDLFYNKVANLSAKLVACSQLRELDLSSTYMTKLSKDSIRLMTQLRFLTVQGNFLTKVPDDIQRLSSLQVLNLGDNMISELNCEDFVNTTGLTELYLSANHISTLDGCVFENMNELKVLDLSNNLLWKFNGVFKHGPQKLEFLDLSKNVFSTLKKGDFQGLGSLKFLDVVSIHMGRVKHKAFDGLTSLANLSVALPLGFENKFRGLQLLGNLTIYFFADGSFRGPHPNLSKAFFNLNSLKVFTIICAGDHFGFPFDIPIEMLQAMKRLEEFTAVNFYTSAPDPYTFLPNVQLKSLIIRQTDLSDLDPELFLPIPNLQVLDLSNTKIKSVDFLAQVNLSALRCLKLRENELTVINETLFQALPALTYLDLFANPFTCDCSNAGFIQWLKTNNRTLVVNSFQYECSFPVAAQGTKLLDFDVQSCWMDLSFLCFVSSTCVTLLTLLTAFVYHFLRWQLVYAFYLFLAFLYNSRMRRKAVPHRYDAFVSYNIHDEAWVYREMLPELEGVQGRRLCLHHRDFQPGKPIIDNITEAIYSSRKTICVISQHYLQSEWCSREIQMASFRLFDEQKDVLVLLFLEDIPSSQLSPYYRMRKLVKRSSYLSWSQAVRHPGVFWQSVGRALETGDQDQETRDLLTGPAGL